jgi:hypothetical protein
MTSVVDRCDERRRDYRTDARQLRQPPASFVRPANLQELLIQLVEPEVESLELVEQVAEETPREIGKFGGRDGVLRLF